MMQDPMASFRLDGKTALVTGARREIGRAIALALAGLGARVAVHHLGNEEETRDAAEVVATMASGGAEGHAFAADFPQRTKCHFAQRRRRIGCSRDLQQFRKIFFQILPLEKVHVALLHLSLSLLQIHLPLQSQAV